MRKRKHGKVGSWKRLVYVFSVVFIILCLFIYFFLNSPNQPNPNIPVFEQGLKAAIIDHLSISQPNEDFWQTSKAVLEEGGFKVDYYPGEDVTVDFYRGLPSQDYHLIVFRVHSTATPASAEFESEDVLFFTSEEYSTAKHVSEQLSMQVARVRFTYDLSHAYFGINQRFVKDSMKGRFNDTVIVMMGCEGLKYTGMAEAFIERGASVYVSWNGPVGMEHTDRATTYLLQQLIAENQTIGKAVTETRNEIGSDPVHGSTLEFYLPQEGSS